MTRTRRTVIGAAAAVAALVGPAAAQPGGFVEQAHLVPQRGAQYFWSGLAVAIDGDTALVTRRTGDAVDVFTRNGSSWTERRPLRPPSGVTGSGPVALDGDTAVVGSSSDTTPSGTYSGSVQVFRRAGGAWAVEANLVPAAGADDMWFGSDVALDRDTLVVGTRRKRVFVYVRTADGWALQAQIRDPSGQPNSYFGGAVAIDGDTLVVGDYNGEASGISAGTASVFVRSAGHWSLQVTLAQDDPAPQGHDCADQAFFGSAVAIDRDTILVGAFGDDTDAGIGTGSAYVFTRSGTTWSVPQHLTAADAGQCDQFGGSVAIDGGTAVIGSYLSQLNGAAYVFQETESGWVQRQRLVSSDIEFHDLFGSVVAIDRQTILVGAHFDDTPAGTDAGSTYVFSMD